MHTVLLAAGQGIRLRPLTADKPKAMLSVAGHPMLKATLQALKGDITIVTGHGKRALQNFVGDGNNFGVQVTYSEQKQQLGPGHALFTARPDAEEFLVLPADAWYHPALIKRLQEATAPAMIQVPDSRSGRHGVPVVEDGQVTDLLEAEDAGPRANRFCGGAYKMDARIFKLLEANDFSMRDAIRAHIKKHGAWNIVEADANEYVDVIEVQDLLAVQDILIKDITTRDDGIIEDGALVSGHVAIGKGTVVRQGAIIQGPATIGEDCEIGPGAVILPGTSIRNRTRIEPLTLIQRASIASNVAIGPHSRIRDAFIDNGARLGAYTHFEAGTGSIIGADAVIHDRVTIQAAATIGRTAKVASGRAIGDVPDGGQAV